MNGQLIIGIDLGGTKIMTGAIDFNGRVYGTPVKVKTAGNDTAEAIVKRVTDSVESLLHSLNKSVKEVAGIGIGSTGPLDIDAGLILECPQLPNMHYFPLRRTIEDYFGIPVYLNNDANCLVYGETIFGAAADNKNVAGFTLGTGIGCAVILDKKIFNGSTGTAAEIWISPYGSGIIEDYVSAAGVSRLYKERSGKDKTSLEIFELAQKGDGQALQTWNEFGKHLSVPVSWTINLIDPEIVILGGAIAGAYNYFRESMEKSLVRQVCPVPARKTKVVPGKLGDNAGFIGAACLVIENYLNHSS